MASTPAETAPPNIDDMPYRPCVGIMLLNARGEAWIGRRLPKWVGDKSAHIWQMPQGGIDKRETPLEAAFRELQEETSVTSAELIGEIPGWLSYDLPDDLLGVALKGKYRGQKQRWFAMRFTGKEREIDIKPRKGLKAEFDQWRWEAPENLPSLIVPFKRKIYEDVVGAFAPLARAGR
jgi:putative (di)nucleoside polyphosphate hydrolase